TTHINFNIGFEAAQGIQAETKAVYFGGIISIELVEVEPAASPYCVEQIILRPIAFRPLVDYQIGVCFVLQDINDWGGLIFPVRLPALEQVIGYISKVS